MIGKLIFLALLALSAGRPADDDDSRNNRLWEPCDLCLPDRHHLISHEWDCTKFYYCQYGMKYVQPTSCAAGTEFAYAIQVCVTIGTGNCNLPGYPPTDVPHETPTTQPPTTLPPTTQPPTTQPPTTQPPTTQPPTTLPPTTLPPTTWPPTTWPPTTQPPTTQPPTTQPPTTRPPTTLPPTTRPPTTLPPTTQPTPQPPFECFPNGCPVDFSIHHLLPHAECNKFYYCNFGNKVERQCAPGTYFNFAIQVCDHPWNVQCASTPTTQPPTTRPPTTQPPTTQPPTTQTPSYPTTQPPMECLPNGCPVDFSIHHLLPHAECNKFYYCNFGEKVERQCAPGTYFNFAIQVCDHPWNVQCASTPTTQPPTTRPPTTQPPTTQPPTTQTPSYPTTQPPMECLPNGCPVDFSIHHLLPHAECNKFYYCNFGEKVERQCAPGTYFNYAIQVCDHPWNVQCASTPTTQAPTTQPPTTQTPSYPTTQPPMECLPNGCPVDFSIHHLLPHAECNKFYYCNFGNKVERQCAPGTYFNYAIQVCDHPWNVECAGNGGSGENGGSGGNGTLPNGCPTNWQIDLLLPHETDCAKYYSCVHGNKVEMPCAAGTHFSYATQRCDNPAVAGCLTGGGGGSCGGSGGSGGCGGSSTESSSESTSTESSGETGTLPNGCPANWQISLLLPHETDCAKYYSCVHGNKVEMPCAAGTHFSYATQTCENPSVAGCLTGGGGGSCGGSGGSGGCGSSSTESSSESTSTESSGETGTLPNGCPSNWQISLLLPHETDCAKYYSCVHGNKVEMPCAAGTHFSYATQTCENPSVAGCLTGGGGGSCGGSGGSGGCGGSSTESSSESTSTESSGETGTLPNGCPSNWQISLLLPHETDCAKYYSCVHGNKVEMPCAAGTHFSYATQTCENPSVAGCLTGGGGGSCGGSGGSGGCGGSSTESSSESTSTESSGETGTLPNGCPSNWQISLLLPHETDCAKYYSCVHGNKVEMPCAAGTHFSYATQTCENPSVAGCLTGGGGGSCGGSGGSGGCGGSSTESSSESTSTESSGETGTLPNGCPVDWQIDLLLPHETDCAKFYSCVFGYKVQMPCAPGTHFSYAAQTCVHPADANCTLEGGCGSENGCENGGNGEIDRCKDNCNVLPWPHATDCDKFWRCDGEKSILTVCGDGLHFNSNTFTCDFKCNAGCVQEDARATIEGDGVKIFLPWDKVDSEMERLIELSMHHEIHHQI